MSTRPPLLIATGLLLAISVISLALPHLGRLQALWAISPAPTAGMEDSIGGAGANVETEGVVDAGESKTMTDLDDLARQQLSIGALLTPTGANAAETWLVMLQRDRSSAAGMAGIESVIAASTPILLQMASKEDAEDVRKHYLKLELIADLAQVREGAEFSALREKLNATLHGRVDALIDAGKRKSALEWMRLASDIGFESARWKALSARLQSLPLPGKPVRDAGGTEFMLVPARINGATSGKDFLMMRNEVSRSDYARFAQSTNRESSRCRNRLSPLRIFDRRNWSDPGFKQSGDEPVVCISYDDASAYAAWLGRKQGENYRLPSKSEWLHAARSIRDNGVACSLGNVRDNASSGVGTQFPCRDGFEHTAPVGKFTASTLGINDLHGNVSEWSSSCTGQSERDCQRRAALGLSWQDGPDAKVSQLRDLPSGRGYDDVGFRLVRDP